MDIETVELIISELSKALGVAESSLVKYYPMLVKQFQIYEITERIASAMSTLLFISIGALLVVGTLWACRLIEMDTETTYQEEARILMAGYTKKILKFIAILYVVDVAIGTILVMIAPEIVMITELF